MKKKYIIIIAVAVITFLVILGVCFSHKNKEEKIKNAIVKIIYKDDLITEFLSEVKVSDFIESINGKIVEDYEIDTTTIGSKDINYEYINDDNIKLQQSFKLNIVDKTAPVVWLGSSYSVSVGSKINLLDKIMCGDNFDNNPKCEIIGDYDMNKVNSYPLVFKATDSSGNTTEKKFNLNVYKPKNTNNNTTGTRTKTYFSDVIKNYKNVCVLRTFSKAYGLAALRIGYIVANSDIITELEKVRVPFNVSTISQMCALIALEEKDYIKKLMY